jgi:putative two-component system response regulator
VADEARPGAHVWSSGGEVARPDSTEVAFMALVKALEARDPGIHGHSARIARYAVATGRAIGLRGVDLEALRLGGYLHDIGKVGVPDAVLLKPGPLTLAEFAVMRRHAEIGDRLCAPLDALSRIRPIVLSHHERIDGSGYPHGLAGDAVPLLAQIVGIVDVYDALTSERSYRNAASHGDAVRHIQVDAEAGRFDKHLVKAFLANTGHRISHPH